MKHIRVADIVLFIMLIAAIFLISNIGEHKDKSVITINTSNKSYRYSLDVDRILEIEGLNGISIIEIKNEQVYFLESPCPDKLCIKDGVLKNKPLICMVNAVVVRHSSRNTSDDNHLDSIGY